MRRFVVVLLAAAVALPPVTVARADTLEFIRPVRAPIIRHFEPPPTPYAAGHRGVDFEVPEGTLVVAAGSGRVAFAGPVGGTIALSIDHPNGLRSTYSFLGAVVVRAGDDVLQGQAVARSGPGHGGGAPPALHFGIRHGEEYRDPEALLLDAILRHLWSVLRLTADASPGPGGP